MKHSDAELRDLAEELLDALCTRFPMDYRPAIVWKPLRVSAGMAYFRQKAIGLSSILLIDSERLERTMVHEYAHLLAVYRHGIHGKGHGPHWQQAMIDLGEKPEVYHRYEVQRNQRRQTVRYQCLKCGVGFDRARKLTSLNRYRHVNCGGKLKFVGVEES